MGIFEWLFFRNAKKPHYVPPMDLNLQEGVMGPFSMGMKPGEIMETLGPPVSWLLMKRDGYFLYPELGLAIEVEDDKIVGFDVANREPQSIDFRGYEDKWKPFAGRIRIRPDSDWMNPDNLTTKHFLEQAGEPTEIQDEPEDGEIVYMYWNRRIDWDAEFLPSGEMKCIRLWPGDEIEDEESQDS